MKVLVLAEHNGATLHPSVFQAVSAAQFWQAPVEVLVVGHNIRAVTQQAAAIEGVNRVIEADAEHLKHQLAEDLAELIAKLGGYDVILAAHASFSRNILPRVAALLDVAMISDALELQANNTYIRSIYAGNVYTVVQSNDATQVLTIHASNFAHAGNRISHADIHTIDTAITQNKTRWLSEVRSQSERPALSTAKVVVSGGRSLGSAETFDKLLSPLANKLGAALGATRAAVDAGYAPNDIQVGQTGVTVAPDLYIAVGISGAVQHLYGMKDSKVVVAINQDPDAPIFQVADYGLVADLFDVIPELTAAI